MTTPTATRVQQYLGTEDLAAHLDISESTLQRIRHEPWFPLPIMLSPKIYRWSVAEVDEALRTRAPRMTPEAEPEALQTAREIRRRGVIVRGGRIVKEVHA